MPGAPAIKFCGITRPQDAAHAAELGAWAVGMVMWPGSPRRCDPAVAGAIVRALRRRVELAGVFVNASLDHVTATADVLGLTLVQLHGDEGPAYCAEVARRTGARVIKAMRVGGRADVQALRPFHTDLHLLDARVPGQPGGTGQTFEWSLAREAVGRGVPVILSGGLSTANVTRGIREVRPWGVDVASGVESAPGIKDHEAMEAFAAAVAGAWEPAGADLATGGAVPA